MVNLKKEPLFTKEGLIEEHCGYPVFAEGMECAVLDRAFDLMRDCDAESLRMKLLSYDENLGKLEVV